MQYEQSKNYLEFILDQEQGEMLFCEGREKILHRMYGDVKVYVHSMQYKYSFKTNVLKIRFYVLQQDISIPESRIFGLDMIDQ